MTAKPSHWRKFKLTEDSLYRSDRAMPYWLQFPAQDFIRLVVDDLQREIQAIDDLIAFMLGDPDAAALTLDDLSRKMVVQEIGNLIARRTRKVQAVLDIACHYAALNSPTTNTPNIP